VRLLHLDMCVALITIKLKRRHIAQHFNVRIREIYAVPRERVSVSCGPNPGRRAYAFNQCPVPQMHLAVRNKLKVS
jgi:hypothetical protein